MTYAQQDAVEYVNTISDEYTKILDDCWSYIQAFAHSSNVSKSDKARQKLVSTITSAYKTVSSLPPFHNDTRFRNAVLTYLQTAKEVFDDDYSEIIDLEGTSEESFEAMEKYLLAKNDANKKLDIANDIVMAMQDKFAEDNNIRLVEPENKNKGLIEEAVKAINKYNQVYLVFFKSYKEEAFFIDAFESQKVENMDIHRKKMLTYAKGGMKVLDTISLYKNDKSLNNACANLLQFYIDEAENRALPLMRYYLDKDRFEKEEARYKSLNKKDITNEDIDKYNDALDAYNKSVSQYNIHNDYLNAKRAQLIDQWNNISQGYLDKHIP